MKPFQHCYFAWWILLLSASGLAQAETVIWSDNFETNAENRWMANSGWQIGAPTAGPAQNAAGYRTHTGTNCAATGLNANAQANTDSRLICTNYNNGSTNLLIPPANQYPRLRFWQWFNFVNALGYVEIKAGTNAWQSISTKIISLGSTANSSGGVWSRPSVDLSAFAGQRLQIAFHFTSGGSGYGTDPGWFIDDVAVVTDAPVLNNPEGFETGLGDWSVDTGTWGVGTPTNGPNKACNGTNCAGTVLSGNYSWNADSRLISPPFMIPSSGNPALHYRQLFNFINAQGFVEILSGTNSWQSISPTNSSVGSAVASTGGVWTTNTIINLSAYSGQTAQVAFHFQSGGSGYGNAPGWYVDDVSLVSNPVLSVPADQTLYAGQSWSATNYATLMPTNGTPLFTLVSPPAAFTNLNLNPTNGILTWAIPATQSAVTSTLTVMVTDSSIPPLSTTNNFVVNVVNPWVPVLTVPPPQTIYAGQPLSVTLSASNSFFPSDTFTFALLSGLTNGLNKTNLPANGGLTWATTTALAAGTFTNVVTATDNNAPYYTAANVFLIVVSNPPLPVLTLPALQTIYAGRKLDITTISATNSAFPYYPYSYATNSAPAGVSINPTNGELTWIPTNAPSVSTISVRATDTNSPPLSGIGSFQVIVSPPPPPPTLTVGTQTNRAGQTLNVILSATNTYLTNSVFTYLLPSLSTNYWIPNNGVLMWTNTGINNGQLTWTNNSVSPGTNLITIVISDDSEPPLTTTNQFSLVFLPPTPPNLITPTNQLVYAGHSFTVSATNSVLTNATYAFSLPSVSTNVLISANGVLTWTNTTTLSGTNSVSVKVTDNSVPPLSATNIFAVIVTATPPVLIVSKLLPGNHAFQFSFQTLSNTTWRIDASTNLLNWQPILTNPVDVSGTLQFTDVLATNFPHRFYRAAISQ